VEPFGSSGFTDDPDWRLRVEDTFGKVKEYTLLTPVSKEELENVCNVVNQAIADLRSF